MVSNHRKITHPNPTVNIPMLAAELIDRGAVALTVVEDLLIERHMFVNVHLPTNNPEAIANVCSVCAETEIVWIDDEWYTFGYEIDPDLPPLTGHVPLYVAEWIGSDRETASNAVTVDEGIKEITESRESRKNATKSGRTEEAGLIIGHFGEHGFQRLRKRLDLGPVMIEDCIESNGRVKKIFSVTSVDESVKIIMAHNPLTFEFGLTENIGIVGKTRTVVDKTMEAILDVAECEIDIHETGTFFAKTYQ